MVACAKSAADFLQIITQIYKFVATIQKQITFLAKNEFK